MFYCKKKMFYCFTVLIFHKCTFRNLLARYAFMFFPLNLSLSVNTVEAIYFSVSFSFTILFPCRPAICYVNMFIYFPRTNIQLTKIRTSRLEPLHSATKMRFLLNKQLFGKKKKSRNKFSLALAWERKVCLTTDARTSDF